MKVSLNTAQYYSNVDLKSVGIEEVVRKIGAQLGEVEGIINWGSRYDGVLVAKVVSCEKHPDADKLHVCRIDDGGKSESVERGQDGLVQVVCGAPNVREGLVVAWLPPGSTVPSTFNKDPFVLEVREIRGKVSNGMLASPAELDISDNHDGILEINADEVGEGLTRPGTPLKQLYGLDDIIVEIENKMFTHRPDCFGILGVAREVAGIQGLAYKSPDWYLNGEKPKIIDNLPLEVKVEDSEFVPRFMAVAMSDIQVMPSPIWLQSLLAKVGIKPINNIVDLTNYYSLLTGQPLHAYDYDKVAMLSDQMPIIKARKAKKGENIALLNGKTIEFEAPTIVIATDKQAIGVGGVIGGSETEVDENTKNIILECATFNMYNIRRTSMKYGLFTDAVTRFTKGQSIYQTDRILFKIISDVVDNCGGVVASEVFDIKNSLPEKKKVTVSAAFINERLGSKLSKAEIKRLLENVEFVVDIKDDDLVVDYPFWRTDIHIPEDIVEEIGRLYGYDNLPLQLPSRTNTPVTKDHMLDLKQKIRSTLAAAGSNEVLTYSFVHGDLIEKVGQDKKLAFKLSNALSPDLQYYRLSLMPSLLDKIYLNVKAGHDEFALFEINKSHCNDFMDKDGLPIEEQRLAFVVVADDKTASTKYSGAPYYQARKYLQYLLKELGFTAQLESTVNYSPKLNVSKQAFAPFEPLRSAIVKNKDGEFIGEIGEFRSKVRKNLKLPDYIAGFELDIEQLLKLKQNSAYSPLSRFPSTDQDISLQVNGSITYQEVYNTVWDVLKLAEVEHGYSATLSPIDIYKPAENDHKNITLRVTLTHNDRTLVTDEVNSLLNVVATASHKKLGATRL